MTVKEFNEILDNNKIVVCKVGASWCGPCQIIKPFIDELEKECTDVKFVTLDADEDEDIVTMLRIRSVPTILYYKDGEVKDKSLGAIPKEQIKNHIDNLR